MQAKDANGFSSTHAFNGVLNHFIDTLRSDYAFVISPQPIVKILIHHVEQAESTTPETEWDFARYPNPARDGFSLRFVDDAPKAIDLLDLSGRVVRSWSAVTGIHPQITIDGLACGAYWVRASDGMRSATKKLLVH